MMRIELHRHLDVSVRTSTLLELAQERGLEAQSTGLDAFRQKVMLRQPLHDLSSVLATFTLFQQVLDRPDVMERAAFEVMEDIRSEGTQAVELRFSPAFICELSHLGWEDALDGFEAGVRKALGRFPEMRAGLICIASRDYGPESVEKTVDFYLKHQQRFIGLDLAGNEAEFPSRLYRSSFRRAKDYGARITVHAGEAGGPENIWEAIEDLGAERIGHGISSVQDPQLLEFLREKSICLEMCPTSNWLTHAVPSLEAHPLPQVLRAGVPVTFNTDDPAVFDTTLENERLICASKMGLSDAEIEKCWQNARQASFLCWTDSTP